MESTEKQFDLYASAELIPASRMGSTAAYDRLIPLVTDSVHSPHSRVAYGRALRDFLAYVSEQPPGTLFSRALVQQYRVHLEAHGKRPSSVNQALSAIRKLADEASAGGSLDPGVAASIENLRGVPVRGTRAGNWLGQEEMLP